MIDFARTTASAVLLVIAGSTAAWAQGATFPPSFQPPAASTPNPVCARLEGQLAAIDRGGFADPARADQSRRYDEAIARQQTDLDRTLIQSRRLGCEGGGFFSIFSGQNPQCPQINQQVQQMRANLERMMSEQQRLQGAGGGQENQRQMVIAALAQNNCGPQYRAAAQQERGFFDSLFGGNRSVFGGDQGGFGAPDGSTTYRTLCVRTCDGYYYPVSFATTPLHFRDDEQICQRTCPGADVALYTHRNPGEEVTQAVSLNTNMPYTQLPTAFKYRTEYNSSCSCRKPGQSWADALGQSRDMTIERGDIVVTEERAKQMSLPRDAQGRPIAPRQTKAQTPTDTAVTPPADVTGAPSADTGKRTVRTVGPPFVPSMR